MAINIKPLGSKVIVTRDEAQKVTPQGIFLPENNKEKPTTGTVEAVGPGRSDNEGNLIPMTVSVGDKVIFTVFSGTEITIGSNKYLIINEEDILAIVDNE